MAYQHVLLATDIFSESTQASVASAAKIIAQRSHATLNHLHVVEKFKHFGVGDSFLCELEQQQYKVACEKMAVFDQQEGISANACWVDVGNVGDVTNNTAKDINADLVVTAEHSSQRLLFHYNDDKGLLRQANTDLLFVKEGNRRYPKIMVVIDIEKTNQKYLIE